MKKLLLCLLTILLLSCASSTGWWFTSAHKLPAVSFLHTQGMSIVNAAGEEVALRGVNIGSWLLIEPWMLRLDGQDSIESEKDIWDLIGKRFGQEAKLDLIRIHRSNFFTEEDVRRIASLGLNCIRVPVWWRAVTDPEYGGDFSWLDRCVRWCEKNGVYVIIDLHGAPGGQSTESRIVGERSNGALWSDARFRQETIDWWKKVADRYKDKPAVAGYDLLNEAYTVGKMDTLASFYNELYKAIRAVDPKHIIFIQDGLLGFNVLPNPQDMGWENVVYSFHYYPKDTAGGVNDPSAFFYRYSRIGLYYGVPVNVGEFNSMQIDRGGISAFQRSCEMFDYFGWSWNFWSYKVLGGNRDYNWGLYGDSANPPPNLNQDSLEDIRSAFKSMRTESLNVNPALEAALAQPSRWPQPDGALLTLAQAFILPDKDEQLRMEWGRSVPNVGYWAPRDRVGWVVDIPEGGVYEGGVRYANSASGNRARIWIDGVQAVDVELANGKSWTVYHDQSLGNLLLAKGRHTIALEKADSNNSFINLQSAWLRKANGPALAVQEKAIWLDAFSMAALPPGSPIRAEWFRNPANLGYWRSATEVSWKINLKKGGTFRGTLTYATPNDDTLFVVYIDRKPLFNSWLKGTGDWHNYKEIDMSLLGIPAGEHTVDVKWETANPEGAGNFGSILLKKE
jgi:endoglucanase